MDKDTILDSFNEKESSGKNFIKSYNLLIIAICSCIVGFIFIFVFSDGNHYINDIYADISIIFFSGFLMFFLVSSFYAVLGIKHKEKKDRKALVTIVFNSLITVLFVFISCILIDEFLVAHY